MERIESFDKYISGEMSETEVAEFKRNYLKTRNSLQISKSTNGSKRNYH